MVEECGTVKRASSSRLAARDAGLRHVNDRQPGFGRQRHGRGFRYLHPDGRVLRSASHLRRIEALAIPPAWRDVWICRVPNGHLQATGVDDRGRKQYLYHSQWRSTRNQTKFSSMLEFGRRLPMIRRRVARDLRRRGLGRDKVLACIVRLLDDAMIRVGNDEYARDNHSFGLTTVRNHHVNVRGRRVQFSFNGKSGRRCETEIVDPRVAQVIRRCQDLPGQELFEYVDERGRGHDVGSDDVNEYLQRISGQAFTAKDFRTWHGSAIAALSLSKDLADGRSSKVMRRARRGSRGRASGRENERRAKKALADAAEALGNTLATCRKFYVHPRLLDGADQPLFLECFDKARRARGRSAPRLKLPERAVLEFGRALEAAHR
jgi:DNA topoisomerase-1